MGFAETVAELSGSRFTEAFVGTPASGRKALGSDEHFKTVPSRPQMLFASQGDIRLHRRTEGVHMAIGVFERQNVVALGQRVEIGVIFQILFRHLPIEDISAALVSKEQVLGQSVGLVPSVGSIFVRPGPLFLTRKSLLGQIRGDRMRQLSVNVERLGVVRELVGIDQAAGQLVVGVGREAIVDKELSLRIECFSVSLYQTIDLRPGFVRSGDRIRPRQAGKILSKTVSGNKSVKIVALQAKPADVVPTAHIFSGRGLAGYLAENLK